MGLDLIATLFFLITLLIKYIIEDNKKKEALKEKYRNNPIMLKKIFDDSKPFQFMSILAVIYEYRDIANKKFLLENLIFIELGLRICRNDFSSQDIDIIENLVWQLKKYLQHRNKVFK